MKERASGVFLRHSVDVHSVDHDVHHPISHDIDSAGPPPVCVDDPSFSMEVIDLDNPNWLALEDPYVLLGCKAIFDPDTGPDLESCTQDFERCYRCCASCRAD